MSSTECNDQLLLELYRKERGLWDPAHPDYRSHSKAKKTLSFIAGRLGNGMTGGVTVLCHPHYGDNDE